MKCTLPLALTTLVLAGCGSAKRSDSVSVEEPYYINPATQKREKLRRITVDGLVIELDANDATALGTISVRGKPLVVFQCAKGEACETLVFSTAKDTISVSKPSEGGVANSVSVTGTRWMTFDYDADGQVDLRTTKNLDARQVWIDDAWHATDPRQGVGARGLYLEGIRIEFRDGQWRRCRPTNPCSEP